MASNRTMKAGYTWVVGGGTIWKTKEADGTLVARPYQQFAVFDCNHKRNANDIYDFWIVLGPSATQNPGYRVGDTVCYNTKGSSNSNADNELIVVVAQGQLAIGCQKPPQPGPLNF